MIVNQDQDDLLIMLSSRRCGGRLGRVSTPVERLKANAVMSPSRNKEDMMLLPGVSLADWELEDNKEAKSRIAQIIH